MEELTFEIPYNTETENEDVFVSGCFKIHADNRKVTLIDHIPTNTDLPLFIDGDSKRPVGIVHYFSKIDNAARITLHQSDNKPLLAYTIEPMMQGDKVIAYSIREAPDDYFLHP